MTGTKILWFILAVFGSIEYGLAQDSSGQFAGVYVLEGSLASSSTADKDAVQLKCLLAPGVMHEGGFGVGYFLDSELFLKTGEISYIKGQEYHCRYSSETRKETCSSKEFSDGKGLTYFRSNVYETFTREVQRGHSLLTPEDVVAWNARREVDPATRFAYRRCDCLKVQDVEANASLQPNMLSSEETGRRLFWWNRDATDDELNLARQLSAKLGACRPVISLYAR